MSDNDWWSQYQEGAEPPSPPATNPPNPSESPTSPPAPPPPPASPPPLPSTSASAAARAPVPAPAPGGQARPPTPVAEQRPPGRVVAVVGVLALMIGAAAFLLLRGGGGDESVVGTWVHPEEGTIVFDDDGLGSITQSSDPVAFTWERTGEVVGITIAGNGNTAEATLSGDKLTFRRGDFSGDDPTIFTRLTDGTDPAESSEAIAVSPTSRPTATPVPTATPTPAPTPTSTAVPTPTVVVEPDPKQSLVAGDCVAGLGLGEDVTGIDCQDERAEGVVLAAEPSVDIQCTDADITLTSNSTDAAGTTTEIGLCIDRLESLKVLFDLDPTCEPVDFLEDQLQAVRCDEGDHTVTFVRHRGTGDTTDLPSSLNWTRGPNLAADWSAGDLSCGQQWEGRDAGSAIVVSTFANGPYSVWHMSDALTLAELNGHLSFSIVTSLCQ